MPKSQRICSDCGQYESECQCRVEHFDCPVFTEAEEFIGWQKGLRVPESRIEEIKERVREENNAC